jgi:hypothetical protein
MSHWLEKVIILLEADTSDLRELARLAGGDPRTFYKGVDIKKLDLADQNIEGMEFSDNNFDAQQEQAELALRAHQQEWPTDEVAKFIKHRKRQEERAALMLNEFLRDRSRAHEIIERYAADKAVGTNVVIRRLREIQADEFSGKIRSDLYIARRVSGAFARAEDKRHIVTYYIAKYLHDRPEIKQWLRGKSIHKLSFEQQNELRRWLSD